MSLTNNDQRVFVFITDYNRNNGYSPTLLEIKDSLGFQSLTSVQRSISSLEENGYIIRDKYQQRGIKFVNQDNITVSIPLVGNVACGTPILAEENIEGYIGTDIDLIKGSPKEYFYLRARGDSMDNAGIDDGDLVLIHSQSQANDGDKVVALLNDSATIKKLHKGTDYISLIPESHNPSYQPIILKENFLLQGIVIKVVKS